MQIHIVGIQGDLLLIKINEIPKNLKKRDGKVLVYGEVTNHKHQVIDGDIYEDEEKLYLQTYQPTQIIHEEHEPIPIIEPAKYRIVRQREYKRDNMTELVVD